MKKKTSASKKNPGGQVPPPMGVAHKARRVKLARALKKQGQIGRNHS